MRSDVLDPLGVARSWRLEAACVGLPLEDVDALFFPRSNTDRSVAIGVCRRCPVALECLEDALRVEATANHWPFGIRGGTYAEQRRRILATRERATT